MSERCSVRLRSGDRCAGTAVLDQGCCVGHLRKRRVKACVDVLWDRGRVLKTDLEIAELIERLDKDPSELSTEELGLIVGRLEGIGKWN